MAHRTFAIGDIHGDLEHLNLLLGKLPAIDGEDTVVFLGDYLDRGPRSKEVIQIVRALDHLVGCNVICLRGNHEDAWLRVLDRGWPEFVLPPVNGCLATMRSFTGGAVVAEDEAPSQEEWTQLFAGSFFPDDIVAWMKTLPDYYEDDHAIYVHAGLHERAGAFVHPRDTDPKAALFWTRSEEFFRNYRGKRVVVGHTKTTLLPPELSSYTVHDPTDLWAGENVVAIDTGCGKGGFLTAVEFPACVVYESRTR